MDIYDEINRLRRERTEAAASIRRDDALRVEGARQVQARISARESELLPFGQTFVWWARKSRIKPTVLTSRTQNLLIYIRAKPVDKGWPLVTNFAVSNEDRGGYGGIKQTLAVLTSGEIKWFGKNAIVGRDEAQRLIAVYVANSRSRVPWPRTAQESFIDPGPTTTSPFRDTTWL